MANNATFTFAITVDIEPPMASPIGYNIFNQIWVVASGIYQKAAVLISHTVDTAIPLGGVSAAGYFAFRNADPVNFISIKTSNGGVEFARPGPGRAGVLELPPTLAPYARADTADAWLEYYLQSR